jgi:hypothetical protein
MQKENIMLAKQKAVLMPKGSLFPLQAQILRFVTLSVFTAIFFYYP